MTHLSVVSDHTQSAELALVRPAELARVTPAELDRIASAELDRIRSAALAPVDPAKTGGPFSPSRVAGTIAEAEDRLRHYWGLLAEYENSREDPYGLVAGMRESAGNVERWLTLAYKAQAFVPPPAPSLPAEYGYADPDEDWTEILATMAAMDRERPAIEAERKAIAEERHRELEGRLVEAAELRRMQRAGLVALPRTWWGHLVWLHREFGEHAFTAAEVRDRAAGSPDWTAPPGLRTTPDDPRFAKQLGMAYAAEDGRMHDGRARVDVGGMSHGRRSYSVTVKDD